MDDSAREYLAFLESSKAIRAIGFIIFLGILFSTLKNAIGGWLIWFYSHLYIGFIGILFEAIFIGEYWLPYMWVNQKLYVLFLLSSFTPILMKTIAVFFASRLLLVNKRNSQNLLIFKKVLIASIFISFLSTFIVYKYFPDAFILTAQGLFIDFILLLYILKSYRVKFVFIYFPNSWDYEKFKEKLTLIHPLKEN